MPIFFSKASTRFSMAVILEKIVSNKVLKRRGIRHIDGFTSLGRFWQKFLVVEL